MRKRPPLAESMLIAVGGTVLGTVIAIFVVHVLTASATLALPRMQDVGIDIPVLAFAATLAVGTGAVFGLIPALHASGWDVASTRRGWCCSRTLNAM